MKLHNYETHVTQTLAWWRQRAIFQNHNWLLKLTYQFFFAHCVLSTCWISTFVLSNLIKRTFLIGKEMKVPLRFNKIFFTQASRTIQSCAMGYWSKKITFLSNWQQCFFLNHLLLRSKTSILCNIVLSYKRIPKSTCVRYYVIKIFQQLTKCSELTYLRNDWIVLQR